MITLELPPAISENAYRRYVPGTKYPIISADGRKYHETVKFRFQNSQQQAIRGPVKVKVEYFPPDRRKRDLDNQFKCLFDALVKAGCIEDDAMIIELHAFKREVYVGGLLYVEITGAI